jgi:DNA polymerase-3 subunit gamma/tau
MTQQSLYRRYRPRRFSEIRGQAHIVTPLRNAVAQDTVGQAYLFSGPRGTGKTTTARILAKALNCTNLADGEPCGACESCRAIDAGSSYDLFELDAASNNGVDAMRDLVARAAVGSPGRTKVYILDEVHMLSAAAANALLKTLEEPPEHVAFVLATTDPHKVLPTIRSRTQHFEFTLLGAEQLTEYVRFVAADAGLDLSEDEIAHVVRAGRGSARDTLSALDQVVAAGGVLAEHSGDEQLVAALAGRDTAGAIAAIDRAIAEGQDPRPIAEDLLVTLRNGFLATVGALPAHLPEQDVAAATQLGSTMGAARLTRSMETVGAALVDMRHAPDARVPLEVAIIRLTAPSVDADPAELLERVEQLERRLAALETRPAPPSQATARPAIPPPPRRSREARPATPTPTRGGSDPSAAPPSTRGGSPPPSVSSSPERAPDGGTTFPDQHADAPADLPGVDELAAAMAEGVLGQLRGVAKAIYSTGRFVGVEAGAAVFALANAPTRDRAERVRADVEAALAARFGRPIRLRLVDEQSVTTTAPADGSGAARPADGPARHSADEPASTDADDDEEEIVDVSELVEATDVVTTGVDRLTEAFPGATLVEEEP